MLRLAVLLAATLVSCASPGARSQGGGVSGATSTQLLAAWQAAPVAGGGALPALAAGATAPRAPAPWLEDDEGDDEGHGFLVGALLYLPNRILDVLDIVRARVRLGPGVAVGARATELADVFAGAYATVFAGLPGPRNRALPKLPVGLETKSGAEASVVDATVEGPIGPDYGSTEFGLSLQFLIVGVDVGIDPGELLDFVVGLVTFDPKDDDF